MKNLGKLYALSSVIFLAVMAIAPLKDFFKDWRHYQHEYNRLIEEQPRRMKPVAIGIKQIWNAELDRVDRCVTCHVGLKEKTLGTVKQPFRTHPRIPHDFDEIGCTICHKGQGLATSFPASIGKVDFWDQPILPKPYLEASCGTCHKESTVPDAPVLSKGRRLIEEYNCVACHKIAGFGKSFTPTLDGIGSKTTRSWLVRWLKNPRAVEPTTKMPHFFLADAEANLLADFLMSFRLFTADKRLAPLPLAFAQQLNDESLIELGGRRFREARCISCHLINGRGGHLAPELGKIASKTDVLWLYNYLKNPRALQPGVEMPQYGFSEKDLAAVTAYMLSEFVDYEAPEDTAMAPPADPNFFENGLKLFNKYNCGGCHQLSGITLGQEMGPELSTIGSKKLYEIDFGRADIEHTLPSYLHAKLKTPRAFLENLRMPDYQFSDEELQALTTALLSLTQEKVPGKYVVSKEIESTYRPQGDFGKIVEKYACFGCHKINGRGETIAPDLTHAGSQLQRRWTEEYFKVPYSLRPIVEERMPNLFISDEEIKTLADYFELALVDDEMAALEVSANDANLLAEGEKLYHEKYGCQACHQLGGRGGYVGPPLDNVGARLTSGWIYAWLKNPQKYKPATIEPRLNLSDDEAKALVAYLMKQKT